MVCLPLNRCDICADIFTFSLSSASEMHSMMLQNRGAIRSSHFDAFVNATKYALQLFWRGTGKNLGMTTDASREHSVVFRFEVEENVYVSELRYKLNFSNMLSVLIAYLLTALSILGVSKKICQKITDALLKHRAKKKNVHPPHDVLRREAVLDEHAITKKSGRRMSHVFHDNEVSGSGSGSGLSAGGASRVLNFQLNVKTKKNAIHTNPMHVNGSSGSSDHNGDVEMIDRSRRGERETATMMQTMKEMKREMQEMKSEMQEIKHENQEMKGENQEIKHENQEMKGENQEIKHENRELKGALQELQRQLKDLQNIVKKSPAAKKSSKRRSFIKVTNNDDGEDDYFQDIETGKTVWDIPADGDLVTM